MSIIVVKFVDNLVNSNYLKKIANRRKTKKFTITITIPIEPSRRFLIIC